jgi:hypothetical protein
MCITLKETELLTQFLHPHSPYALFSASMHDQGQGVNWFVVQQKNHLIRIDELELGTSVKLWDLYLHKITSFVIGVLITFGLGLDWTGGRSVLTYSKLANPELRLLSLSKKFATISLRGSVHVRITRFETSPEVSR